MKHFDEERRKELDALYGQYARGGRFAAYRARLRKWRKQSLWRATVWSTLALKRVLDILGAAAGLTVLSPVLLGTAFGIWFEDQGPIFFRQERVGKRGTLFGMYKFRSMVTDADRVLEEIREKNEAGDVLFKMKDDPRITKIGRVIRKFSIDELPQFINVLWGDMSLVGPRPALPSEVEQYAQKERVRLIVKPGITCLWQIGGRSNLDFQQQVELDRTYIESQSFWGDIKILLKTVPAVLTGKGAY
ncbi:sugar transferase [Desulfobaculum bizertense]|uniref:Exopolysaccharide biosynthesis polyprenyl glycosylphosphotransferase n=1 Tax=Desulfobaculum bizertense DSM 18034 TaxID=1121442 RepID=A0A1T4WNY4_9BACT|nr:sugar transferase [Desulfobaculum bizertense]SKA79052.1 exopolysaccharide biosynthesis polyprenyl glycosylphosphotransferase [Desulfobaculum bizertense DSM 18034]